MDAQIRKVLQIRKWLEEAEKKGDKKAVRRFKKRLSKETATLEELATSIVRKRVLVDLHNANLVKLIFFCTECGYASTEPMEKCKHCGGEVEIAEKE